MKQALYKGKVWYIYNTIDGYKLSRNGDFEILSDEEYDYAIMRGDIRMLEKKEDKKTIIGIKEEVKIGNIILEKGDKIEVLKEDIQDELGDVQEYLFDVKTFIEEVSGLFEGLESIINDPEAKDFFDQYDTAHFNNAQVLLPNLLKGFGIR